MKRHVSDAGKLAVLGKSNTRQLGTALKRTFSNAGDRIRFPFVFNRSGNYHIARNGILPLLRHRDGGTILVEGILEGVAY